MPASTVADFLRSGRRPALGVTLRPLPFGLLILQVEPDGAAAAASLKAGDVLLCSFDELSGALDSGKDVVRLRFLRGDRERVREVWVRVASRAEAA